MDQLIKQAELLDTRSKTGRADKQAKLLDTGSTHELLDTYKLLDTGRKEVLRTL